MVSFQSSPYTKPLCPLSVHSVRPSGTLTTRISCGRYGSTGTTATASKFPVGLKRDTRLPRVPVACSFVTHRLGIGQRWPGNSFHLSSSGGGKPSKALMSLLARRADDSCESPSISAICGGSSVRRSDCKTFCGRRICLCGSLRARNERTVTSRVERYFWRAGFRHCSKALVMLSCLWQSR